MAALGGFLLNILAFCCFTSCLKAQLAIPLPSQCSNGAGTSKVEYFDVMTMRCRQCPENTVMDDSG